jgi:hypothetical protein
MSIITARTHAESHRRGGLIIGHAGSWSGSVGRDGSVLAVSDTAVAHAVASTSVAKWPGTAQFGAGQYVRLAVAAAQGRRASNTAASRSDKHDSSSVSTHHNDARTRPTRQGKKDTAPLSSSTRPRHRHISGSVKSSAGQRTAERQHRTGTAQEHALEGKDENDKAVPRVRACYIFFLIDSLFRKQIFPLYKTIVYR